MNLFGEEDQKEVWAEPLSKSRIRDQILNHLKSIRGIKWVCATGYPSFANMKKYYYEIEVLRRGRHPTELLLLVRITDTEVNIGVGLGGKLFPHPVDMVEIFVETDRIIAIQKKGLSHEPIR